MGARRGADARRRSTRCSPPCASSPTPTARPTLLALRERGIRLVVVSNWDFSLHERLAETGLTPLLDGALASAEVGSAKPDGAIFRAALQLAGTTPEQTWHVGDTPAADVEGARAAGITPILIAREGDAAAGRGPIARRTHTLGRNLTEENNEYRGWLAPEAPSIPMTSRRPRRRIPRSRCGRRSWRWPPRCSSSC